KEQVEPMLATLKAQAEVLGTVETLIADSGFCSEKNVNACAAGDLLLQDAGGELFARGGVGCGEDFCVGEVERQEEWGAEEGRQ
ncbi:MAG: hypothetical protein J0L64_20915, partial [Acidobacteria bacterium]|nr:hypothetical protein [Acidobacteriota bacterium]